MEPSTSPPEVVAGSVDSLDVPVVAVPVLGDEDDRTELPGETWMAVREALEAPGGDRERTRWVRCGAGGPDVLLVRVPDAGRSREDAARRAAGAAARTVRDRGLTGLAVRAPSADATTVKALAEGLMLGDWRYDGLKSEAPGPDAPERRLVWIESGTDSMGEEGHATAPDGGPLSDAARRGAMLAAAQNAARGLVAQPGNVVTPSFLADHARSLEARGLSVQVWEPEKLRSAGFGGLLAVARGSDEEPRFIIMEHAGRGGDPIVLVGKGVTFDTGGISIKPSSGMEDMKYDMGGAAAVLGAMQAAADLDIPQRVIGLVPTTENMPSGRAVKPGDVIRGASGKSIEVINTDAEGRLILSDALSYAQKLSPRAVVDLATLTGACVVALGKHAIGMMTTDDELAAGLEAAGRASGERAWRLPLWPEYRKQLDSQIADLKNVGGREGGAITAGAFLQEFAGEMRWAHLDIAGTAWADDAAGWQPKGATGVGVRLLLEWLAGWD